MEDGAVAAAVDGVLVGGALGRAVEQGVGLGELADPFVDVGEVLVRVGSGRSPSASQNRMVLAVTPLWAANSPMNMSLDPLDLPLWWKVYGSCRPQTQA